MHRFIKSTQVQITELPFSKISDLQFTNYEFPWQIIDLSLYRK